MTIGCKQHPDNHIPEKDGDSQDGDQSFGADSIIDDRCGGETLVGRVVGRSVWAASFRYQTAQTRPQGESEVFEGLLRDALSDPHVGVPMLLIYESEVGSVGAQQVSCAMDDGLQDTAHVAYRGQIAGGLVQSGKFYLPSASLLE